MLEFIKLFGDALLVIVQFAFLVAKSLELIDLGLEEVLVGHGRALDLATVNSLLLFVDESLNAAAALLNLLVEATHLFVELLAIGVLLALVLRNDLWNHSLKGYFLDSVKLRSLSVVELVDP